MEPIGDTTAFIIEQAMATSQARIKNASSVSVLKKALEAKKQMAGVLMGSIAPGGDKSQSRSARSDNLGQNIDIQV